jgi:glycerol-3-phosphate dehydrogenase (NAD(P)+)
MANLKIKEILVIGSGSWGTTLSLLLAEKGYKVYVWSFEEVVAREINQCGTNKKYLGDYSFPEGSVHAFGTKDIDEISYMVNPYLIIFAVPSQFIRNTALNLFNFIETSCKDAIAAVSAAKGIEKETNLRISQVLKEVLPLCLKNKIAALSGPNISSEILRKLPSVSTVSSENNKILKKLQQIFSNDYFRVYTNNDIIGVELCGALKNIIAIAAGISDGMGYASNTKASLITRGLYELERFGKNYGAKSRTFAGIAGMGDLITTCISTASRNRLVGERLAKGEDIDSIKSSMNMIAEGVETTKAVYDMSEKLRIELPIIKCVYDIIYKHEDVKKSVEYLMKRSFKAEY